MFCVVIDTFVFYPPFFSETINFCITDDQSYSRSRPDYCHQYAPLRLWTRAMMPVKFVSFRSIRCNQRPRLCHNPHRVRGAHGFGISHLLPGHVLRSQTWVLAVWHVASEPRRVQVRRRSGGRRRRRWPAAALCPPSRADRRSRRSRPANRTRAATWRWRRRRALTTLPQPQLGTGAPTCRSPSTGVANLPISRSLILIVRVNTDVLCQWHEYVVKLFRLVANENTIGLVV